jgi:hypothetical protein
LKPDWVGFFQLLYFLHYMHLLELCVIVER